jgi:ABC-type sugar transport system permease subunit
LRSPSTARADNSPAASNGLPPVATAPDGSESRFRAWRRPTTAHLLLAPCVILIVVLVFYPMGASIYQSVHDDTPLDPANPYVGLRNYRYVADDPDFTQAVKNTGQYLIFATLASLVIGLVMALWLHSLRRARGAALALIVLPWAVPGTVVGVLWSFILNPTETGLLNAALLRLHLISTPVVWLAHPLAGILLITLTLVWQTVPIAALIMFAALESIPVQLGESARVDGAARLAEFRHITLPLLRPALAISLLSAGVSAIGIYDQIYVLAGFSPQTLSVVGKIYTYSFRDFNFGFGIAASVFVTLATVAISLFYLKVVYREVDYV